MNTAKNLNKKKALGVTAAVLALAVGATASFALFTDTAAIRGATEAGKLAIGITADKMTPGGDFSEQLLNTAFEENVQNFNPGDFREIAYRIDNDQNKAVRTNDTITVKVTPNKAMMADSTKTDSTKTVDDLSNEFGPEGGAIHLVRGEAAGTNAVVTASDGTTHNVSFAKGGLELKDKYVKDGAIYLVYQGSEVNLSGAGTGTNAEMLAADAGTTWVSEETNTVDRAYTLYFEKDALNQWQGAKVDISVDVSAVQYANTAAGDATLNIDTVGHTVATNAGVNTVGMARERVKTDNAGKVVS